MGRYGLYGIDVDGTMLGSITSENISAGTNVRREGSSGEAAARIVNITAQNPRASFTSLDPRAVLAVTDTTGKSLSSGHVATLYHARRSDNGLGVAAGSVHRKTVITCGQVLPRQLNASHQGDATMTADIVALWDGTNDPLIAVANVALPAVNTDERRYAFYCAVLGGFTIDEDVNVTIDFGLSENVDGKRSEIWPRVCNVSMVAATITVRSKNADAFAAANIPLGGRAATHLNTAIYLARRADDSTFYAGTGADHLKITAAGLVHLENVLNASGQATGEVQAVLTAKFDGTNPVLVVDAASALPS